MGKNRTIDSYFITGPTVNNRILVRSSIDVVRMIAFQGWPIYGDHETFDPTNRGNFLEFLELLSSSNEKIRKAMNASPENGFYTSLKFPKEILQVYTRQVMNAIRNEIGDAKFCVIFDEAIDESQKDYIAVVLRFVDRDGFIRERFIGVIYVLDYTPSGFKRKVYSLLSHYNLDVQNIRGQSYNAGNNLWDDFQKLQPLIQVVDMVRVFCKYNEEQKPAYASKFECIISVEDGEVPSWSSHLKSVCGLLTMYDETCTLLEDMIEKKTTLFELGEIIQTHTVLISFDFVYALHLMKEVMGVTNLLCEASQIESLNIQNLIEAVASTKFLLQKLRKEKGDSILVTVRLFCEKWDISVPDLGAKYVAIQSFRRPQRESGLTNEEYYRVKVFYAVIDSQLKELDRRFSQTAMDLLRLTSALSPEFASEKFETDEIYELVEKLYPHDFTNDEKIKLRVELKDYKLNVVPHKDYIKLLTISELCQSLVRTKMSAVYKLVYRVIALVLTLPVFTAATERSFSAINIVKSRFREGMDSFLVSESLLMYIEREIAETFSTKTIMEAFRGTKEHAVPF